MTVNMRCVGGQVARGRVWAGVHFDGAGRPMDRYREATITTHTCGWSGPWRGRQSCPQCGGRVELIPQDGAARIVRDVAAYDQLIKETTQ